MATSPQIENTEALTVRPRPYRGLPKHGVLIKPEEPARSLADYHIRGAQFSPTKLVLDEGMPESEWLSIGKALVHINQASHFWLGDWVEYGRRTYGIITAIDLAVAATGFCRETVKQIAWCSRCYDAPQRNRKASWSVHMALAKFEPEVRERYLTMAAEQGMSAKQVRSLADTECGKKERTFKQKQLSIFLYPETIERLRDMATMQGREGTNLSWFIGHIIEDWLRWKGEGACIPQPLNKMTAKERRALWVSQGICPLCGTNPPTEGYKSCLRCRQRANRWARANGLIKQNAPHRNRKAWRKVTQ